MTWTFDPLQSVNAHFNFGKLGVVSDQYKVDFYGDQSTSFLHRNGTDRLWVTWPLASRRVQERLQSAKMSPPTQPNGQWLIEIDDDGSPVGADQRGAGSSARALIEIPADVDSLEREKPGQAARWRQATRAAFSEALAAGFLVEDFVRASRGSRAVGRYVLNRERTMGDFDEQAS